MKQSRFKSETVYYIYLCLFCLPEVNLEGQMILDPCIPPSSEKSQDIS